MDLSQMDHYKREMMEMYRETQRKGLSPAVTPPPTVHPHPVAVPSASSSGDPPSSDTAVSGETPTPSAQGVGMLQVHATTGRGFYPVSNAKVTISGLYKGQTVIWSEQISDESGKTSPVPLPAPPKSLMDAPSTVPVYSSYNVTVEADDFVTSIYQNVPIFDGVTSLQAVDLLPLLIAGENRSPRIFDTAEVYPL